MIDLAILGLLKDQELHGYELKKRLTELLGARSSVSFGSLYPALARLERNGLVKAVEAHTAAEPARTTVPSSGSLKGELAAFRARYPMVTRGARGKKVYGITQRGDDHLVDLLADPSPGDDRTFAVCVAFCRHLRPTQRLELFERRRVELAARLAERRRRDGREGRFDLYLRSLREHDDEAMTHDLAWIDRLIDAERQAPQQEGSIR